MKVKIVNKSKHKIPDYKIEKSAGMDIRANISGQIKLKTLERSVWQEVEVLEETDRGSGGFGHKGKK